MLYEFNLVSSAGNAKAMRIKAVSPVTAASSMGAVSRESPSAARQSLANHVGSLGTRCICSHRTSYGPP
jgi:hypothetical protein